MAGRAWDRASSQLVHHPLVRCFSDDASGFHREFTGRPIKRSPPRSLLWDERLRKNGVSPKVVWNESKTHWRVPNQIAKLRNSARCGHGHIVSVASHFAGWAWSPQECAAGPWQRNQDEIAAVAQLVEHVLGKDEVMGSSPISSFRTESIRVRSLARPGIAAER